MWRVRFAFSCRLVPAVYVVTTGKILMLLCENSINQSLRIVINDYYFATMLVLYIYIYRWPSDKVQIDEEGHDFLWYITGRPCMT